MLRFALAHLDIALALLWATAFLAYGAKSFSARWDHFTRYGKLQTRQWAFISVSAKAGWLLFYCFSCGMFFLSFRVSFPPRFPNVLLFLHSTRRLIETVFVTKFTARRMHFVNLCAGLLFYAMAPLTLAYCARVSTAIVPPSLVAPICFALNSAQFHAHKTLASLPKYSIPTDPLFAAVASPHYFIEILLYAVYALSAPHWLSLVMVLFVAWNLRDQAKLTHRWYAERFGSAFTALNRAILVPLVY
jgi:hypothetical protein